MSAGRCARVESSTSRKGRSPARVGVPSTVMRARWIVGGLLIAVRSASAAPCEAEAAALRTHLTDEAARAHRWDLGWGIGLGTVAAGQLALGLSGAFGRDLH